MRAGSVIGAAMLYIISVNSSVLVSFNSCIETPLDASSQLTFSLVLQSDSGGPCICENPAADDPICAANLAYNLCKNELRRDYVTSTSAISLIATFLMGLLANMPLGLAPGLGGQSVA